MDEVDLESRIRTALRSRELPLPSGGSVVRRRQTAGTGSATLLLVAGLTVTWLIVRALPQVGSGASANVGGAVYSAYPVVPQAQSLVPSDLRPEADVSIRIRSVSPVSGSVISGPTEFRVVLDYRVNKPGRTAWVEFIRDSNGPSVSFYCSSCASSRRSYQELDPAQQQVTITFVANPAWILSHLGSSVFLRAYAVRSEGSTSVWSAWDERPDLKYTVSR